MAASILFTAFLDEVVSSIGPGFSDEGVLTVHAAYLRHDIAPPTTLLVEMAMRGLTGPDTNKTGYQT